MIVINKKKIKNSRLRYVQGSGLLNNLIDKLPFELHLPGGYSYCGPGTRLAERIARNEPGINQLDSACKLHDIAYSETTDISKRHIADKKLQEFAKSRIHSTDSTLGERLSSRLVNFVMAAKRKMGAGMKRVVMKKRKCGSGMGKKKKNTFENNVKKIRSELRLKKPKNQQELINLALNAARRNISIQPKTRIIPLPKTGGIIPFLIPILAALSSAGGIASGVAGVIRTINEIKDGKKKLAETERHNKSIEEIALKSGKGMYLKPYKNGHGLFLKPYSKNY